MPGTAGNCRASLHVAKCTMYSEVLPRCHSRGAWYAHGGHMLPMQVNDSYYHVPAPSASMTGAACRMNSAVTYRPKTHMGDKRASMCTTTSANKPRYAWCVLTDLSHLC